MISTGNADPGVDRAQGQRTNTGRLLPHLLLFAANAFHGDLEGLGHAFVLEQPSLAFTDQRPHLLIEALVAQQAAGDGHVIIHILGDQFGQLKNVEHRHGVTAAHECGWQRYHRAVEREGLHGAVATVPVDGVDGVMADREQPHEVAVIKPRQDAQVVVDVEAALFKVRAQKLMQAIGDAAIASGFAARASWPNAIAMGTEATASDEAQAVGSSASATGEGSLATGRLSSASGRGAIASGFAARASGPNALAVGVEATASDEAMAVGSSASATGEGAISTGKNSSVTGQGSLAYGFKARATNDNTIAVGSSAFANGTNSYAIGADAIANGRQALAIGAGARAEGFNTDLVAVGTKATALGTNSTAQGAYAYADGTNAVAIGTSRAIGTEVVAIGAQATATYDRSSAVGAGAATTRKDQIVLGTFKTEVTAPNLAGDGTEIIAANEDGTLQRTSMSFKQLDKAVRKKLPKLESAARGLGQAVQASGAIASAMSAIPEVTLQEDEPARCGVGTGAYGSQYAISAGCAVRVGDRLHLNGALLYTPSVDYEYGSTASIAGRLGFSFPLGKKKESTKVSSSEISEYRT